MDPRCTPQRVLHAHAPDQFAKLAIDPQPPRPIPRPLTMQRFYLIMLI
jgi:hypothetical protein